MSFSLLSELADAFTEVESRRAQVSSVRLSTGDLGTLQRLGADSLNLSSKGETWGHLVAVGSLWGALVFPDDSMEEGEVKIQGVWENRSKAWEAFSLHIQLGPIPTILGESECPFCQKGPRYQR
jgi:hypothetical protein